MNPIDDPEMLAAAKDAAELGFSIIESRIPGQLTKTIGLSAQGTLKKSAVAQLVDGHVHQASVARLQQFCHVLDDLKKNQALMYGVASKDARVVTNSALSNHPEAIARTREYFQFHRGPGIWMNDFDGGPDGEGMTSNELREKLISLYPGLADAPMLIRGSSSAGITTFEGKCLANTVGMRVYVAVADASLIPAAGKALNDLAWAGGMGWIACGNAGQLLERMLFDTSVWQPERLDFAAPPVLQDGLQRTAPEPSFYGNANSLFDLKPLIAAADGNIRHAAAVSRSNAKNQIRPKQEAARNEWINLHAPRFAEERGIDEESAREVLARAAKRQILMGDYIVELETGKRVTVGEILDNPERYHGRRCADPLDPEYHQDKRIGYINLRSGERPFIWSHARGGQRFTLARPSVRILVARGERARMVDDVLSVLRERGEVYDQFVGGGLIRIADSRAVPATVDYMIDLVDRHVDLYTLKKGKEDGEFVEVPVDTPDRIIKSILARSGQRQLPQLSAVVSAPSLRLDGSMIDVPGHDRESGILFLSEQTEVAKVPRIPTINEVVNAAKTLWATISTFPFVSEIDRGVAFAALMTACVRATLPTAPGFGFNAPAAGTGKTLLAQVIGTIAAGSPPAVLPPVDSNEEETRKRLFAAVREGHPVLLLDNVREPLGSASLDAFLTSAAYTDRVLGASETAVALNRSLFMVTGNNLRIVGDTCRRILVCRLDANLEHPFLRRFERDPLQDALSSRQRLVVAGLTIVRGWIAAGCPRLADGSVASFDDWDRLVRQPLVWLASLEEVRESLPPFADPVQATAVALESDPETMKLRALLVAWRACFGNDGVWVKHVIDTCDLAKGTMQDSLAPLVAALEDIAYDGRQVSSRALGRYLERFEGRHVAGMVIRRAGISRGLMRWRVQKE